MCKVTCAWSGVRECVLRDFMVVSGNKAERLSLYKTVQLEPLTVCADFNTATKQKQREEFYVVQCPLCIEKNICKAKK